MIKIINLEQATEKAKSYLAKMKGYDLELQGRKLIDFLDFEVTHVEHFKDYFDLYVSLLDGLFSKNRAKFRLRISKENGEIIDVHRTYEE